LGFGGISIWQLLIILLIVIMLFGTKRLKGLGSDLGDAIKGFRKSMGTDEESPASKTSRTTPSMRKRARSKNRPRKTSPWLDAVTQCCATALSIDVSTS
jgi:twin arginine-targeting protein translocase, TatA/E family